MRFAVSAEKTAQLEKDMAALGVQESDFEEHAVLGAGPGGQKIQKTSSTVFLKHIPTGLSVKVGATRSQSVNRYKARVLLLEKIRAHVLGVPTKREQKNSRIRKQKERRRRRKKPDLDA
jgi:protein subunit release factor B